VSSSPHLRLIVRLRCRPRANFGQLFIERQCPLAKIFACLLGVESRHCLARLQIHARIGSASTVPLAQPRREQRRTAACRQCIGLTAKVLQTHGQQSFESESLQRNVKTCRRAHPCAGKPTRPAARSAEKPHFLRDMCQLCASFSTRSVH
jgi:hypothetical protein